MEQGSTCGSGACKAGGCESGSAAQGSQNGKGDAPRNISQKFRDNYDQIDWGGRKRRKK